MADTYQNRVLFLGDETNCSICQYYKRGGLLIIGNTIDRGLIDKWIIDQLSPNVSNTMILYSLFENHGSTTCDLVPIFVTTAISESHSLECFMLSDRYIHERRISPEPIGSLGQHGRTQGLAQPCR